MAAGAERIGAAGGERVSATAPDPATALAWDAERVMAALRDAPAFEFTVGELIWLVNISQQLAWADDERARAEAQRLLDKVNDKES